jgi:hypothetical protein
LGDGTPFDLGAPSSTTASVTPATTKQGLRVSYSTTVAPTSGSGTPTGTVVFSIDSTPLCTARLSGGAGTCVASSAPLGTDIVTATYSGDPTLAASSGTTTLTVQPGFVITTTSLPSGVVGSPYSYQLAASGGTEPYHWKKTAALPKGLELSSSGELSGTPNARLAPGSYPISVEVKDSTSRDRQTATATFTLVLS